MVFTSVSTAAANGRTKSSSCNTIASGYDSILELVEVPGVDHQHNNNKTNSKLTSKNKSFTDSQNKTILESTENVLSDKTNTTIPARSSQVWQYAIRQADSKYATCCLCVDNKRISTNNGSTSTLRKHLIFKHNLHELVLPTHQEKRSNSSISAIKKEQLHNLSIGCIICDGRTFNDLQKPGIKKLLEELVPGYIPPNRYLVARRLKRLHVIHHKKLINDLASIDDISITMDLSSNRQMRCFLVITGHYFQKNNYNLRSTILNFSTFDKQHSSIEISRILSAKLKELDISQKVARVTCDGGRNMVHAIDNMDLNLKRVWCVAHRLHLTITNAFSFWMTKKERDEETAMIEEQAMIIATNDEEEEMTNLEDFQDNDEMNMDTINNLEFDDIEPMGIGDSVHEDDEELLSNMIDEKITENWIEDVIEFDVGIAHDQEMIMCLLKKCRSLVSMVKRSTILTLFFDDERKKLNIKRNLCYDVKSRWNSTYSMIDAFLVLRELIEKLFNYKQHLQIKPKQRTKLAEFELTNGDWIMLSQLHLVLKPFFHATKVMSGSQYPSMGLAFHLLTRLKNFLPHHEKKQNLMIKRLKQLLLKRFLIYFENDHEQMEVSKLHAYFDPAGFATLTDLEKRSVEQNIKKMVTNELRDSTQSRITILPISTITNDTSNKSCLHEKSTKSAMDMFNESVGELHYEVNPHDENKQSTIIDDIHNYRKYVVRFNLRHKQDASSSTLFWNTYGQNFSILGKLAKKMPCLPATSVPSESCFSLSAFLGRKERARLTGENLASSVFLQDKMGF